MHYCFAKICRLCTENKNIKLNLYTMDSDNIPLLDKLLTLVPDTVKCTNDLPEYICTICYLQLRNAYAFVQKCLKTHKQLICYSKLIKGLPVLNTEQLENKPNSILTVNLEQIENFEEYIEKQLYKIVKEENDNNIHKNEICNSSFYSDENLPSSTHINNDLEQILEEKLNLENLDIVQVKQEKLLECNENDEEVNNDLEHISEEKLSLQNLDIEVKQEKLLECNDNDEEMNNDLIQTLEEKLSLENLDIVQVKQEKLLECNDNDEEVNNDLQQISEEKLSLQNLDIEVKQEKLLECKDNDEELNSLIKKMCLFQNENSMSSCLANLEQILEEKVNLENLDIIQVKQEKLLECNDNDEVNSLIKKICLLQNENPMSSCDVPQQPLNYKTEHNSDLRSLINQNITQNLHTDESANQIDQDVVKTEPDSVDEDSGCVRNTENSYHDLENARIDHNNISNDIVEANIDNVVNFTNEMQVANNTNNAEIQIHNNSNNAEIQNNNTVLSSDNNEDGLSKSKNCSNFTNEIQVSNNTSNAEIQLHNNSNNAEIQIDNNSNNAEIQNNDTVLSSDNNEDGLSKSKNCSNFTNEMQVSNNTSNAEIQLHNNSNNAEMQIDNNSNNAKIQNNDTVLSPDNDEDGLSKSKNSKRSRKCVNYQESDVSDFENSDNDDSYSCSSSTTESDCNEQEIYDSSSSSTESDCNVEEIYKSITSHTTKPVMNYANKNNLPSASNLNNNKSSSSTSNIGSINKTIPAKLLTFEEYVTEMSVEDSNQNNIANNNNLPSTSKGLMENSINNNKSIESDCALKNSMSLKFKMIISENKKVLSRNQVVRKSKKESLHTKLKKLSRTRYSTRKKTTRKITQFVTSDEKENDNISELVSDPISVTNKLIINSGNDAVAVDNNELPITRTNDNVVNSGNKTVINNISENELPIINSNIGKDITKDVDTVNLNMENSDILSNQLPATSTNNNNEIPITKIDKIQPYVVNNTNMENKISRNDSGNKNRSTDNVAESTRSILQSKTVSSDNSNQQQNDVEIVELLSEDDDEVVVNPTYNNLGLIEHELIHPNKPGTTFIYIRDIEQSYFCCKTCNIQFTARYTLDKHLRRHISEKTFKCDKCDYRSVSAKNLKSHMVKHITERNFKCDICNKSFKSKDHLKVHKKLHGEHQFICEICGKAFAREHRLKKHKLLHSDEYNFKCSKCDWVGKTPEYKQRHMRTKHAKTKPEFKCNICNRIFRSSAGLYSHVIKHDEKNLKFECVVCHKKFFGKNKLDVHVRLHTGAKPYKCKYCGKEFRMAPAYQNHLRIHTGQKPFKCDVCEKSFTQQTTLQVHKRIHTGERPYKCDQCGKTFIQSYTYKLHLKKHEKQSETETSCDSSSSSAESCSSDTE